MLAKTLRESEYPDTIANSISLINLASHEANYNIEDRTSRDGTAEREHAVAIRFVPEV